MSVMQRPPSPTPTPNIQSFGTSPLSSYQKIRSHNSSPSCHSIPEEEYATPKESATSDFKNTQNTSSFSPNLNSQNNMVIAQVPSNISTSSYSDSSDSLNSTEITNPNTTEDYSMPHESPESSQLQGPSISIASNTDNSTTIPTISTTSVPIISSSSSFDSQQNLAGSIVLLKSRKTRISIDTDIPEQPTISSLTSPDVGREASHTFSNSQSSSNGSITQEDDSSLKLPPAIPPSRRPRPQSPARNSLSSPRHSFTPTHSHSRSSSSNKLQQFSLLPPTLGAGNGMVRSVSTPPNMSPANRNSSTNQLQYPNSPYNNGGQGHSRYASSVSSLESGHYNKSRSSSINMFQYGDLPSRSHSPAVSELIGANAFDLNQAFLHANLNENSNSLIPRIKTIELYRKNAEKSKDPLIQFQFAQYMLQTALLSKTSKKDNASQAGNPQDELATEDEAKIKKELLKEAVSHLYKLSQSGYPDAQYLLGDAYASGALGKVDLKESFLLFSMAAKHGHAEAAYRAALCLEEGWGTSKDARKAVQLLRQSAAKSHPGAMLRLGIACFYGKLGLHMGSTQARGKTQLEGIKWLTRSAETANETFPQAPFELAKIYEVGYKDIVFVDIPYAVSLYVKSADLNYIPAAAKLGHVYEYGELQCPQDAGLSIHYYTIAAVGGDPTSMLAMCAWYMVGAEPMLPRNEEEAYEWASRAAARGLPKAQYATAYFQENGIGCERDLAQAMILYRKAADGGDERAKERIGMGNVGVEPVKNKKESSGKKKAVNTGSKTKKDKDCVVM